MSEIRRGPTEATSPLHQIVCVTCGYRRAWVAVIAAIADGRRHHTECESCEPPALVTPVWTMREQTGPARSDPPAA